jgi:hypothetical protein
VPTATNKTIQEIYSNNTFQYWSNTGMRLLQTSKAIQGQGIRQGLFGSMVGLLWYSLQGESIDVFACPEQFV